MDRKVFISYSRADESIVRRICQDLSLRNIEYWLDVKEIKVGDSISQKIEEGLQHSNTFCLCLSKSSVTRGWVLREYRTALSLQLSKSPSTMQILPLLLEKCDVPALLLDIKHADFTGPYASGMRQLLKGLGLPDFLTKVRSFDVPYESFIRHIEKKEPLKSFLEAGKAKQRTNLENSWASQMFSLLEKGVRATKQQIEYIQRFDKDAVVSMDNIQTPAVGLYRVLFSPHIRIFKGYTLVYDDNVDPYIEATEGFLEFLETLVSYREEIQSRSVFLLPESYTDEGESYPDGMWEDKIDNSQLRSKLEQKPSRKK